MRRIAWTAALCGLLGILSASPPLSAQSAVERARGTAVTPEVEMAAREKYWLVRGVFTKEDQFAALYALIERTPALSARMRELRSIGIHTVARDEPGISESMIEIDAATKDPRSILVQISVYAAEEALRRQEVADEAYVEFGLKRGAFAEFSDFEAFYRRRVDGNLDLKRELLEVREHGVRIYANNYFSIGDNFLMIDIYASDERIIEFFETGE